MAYKTCPDCGSRIFEYGCVNCNEVDYISMQQELEPLENKEVLVEGKEEKKFLGEVKKDLSEKKVNLSEKKYEGKEEKEESLADLKERIKTLEGIINLKEKERQEWADMCIKKQLTIDNLESKLNSL